MHSIPYNIYKYIGEKRKEKGIGYRLIDRLIDFFFFYQWG